MTKEYIEREALIKDFELMASVQPEYKQSTILGMVSTIKNRKASDVAPVVHGEWIEDKYPFCNVCPHCGLVIDRTCIKMQSGTLNFCPNCGAKMDGGTP